MEVKSIADTEENDFICTNSSDVPPVFVAQILPENLCCESNIPLEIHSCRGSIRIELESSSDFGETSKTDELAADHRRGRTQRTQQLKERIGRVVDGLELVGVSVRLRGRVPVSVEAERHDLWTLRDQFAALRRRHEDGEHLKGIELDFHISAD